MNVKYFPHLFVNLQDNPELSSKGCIRVCRLFRSTFIASNCKYMINNEFLEGEKLSRSSLVPGSDTTDLQIL